MNKDGAGFASNIVCLFEKWRGHVRRVEYSDGINPIFETFKQFVQHKSFKVKINISGRNWMRQKTKIRNINIFHLIILFSLTLFSLNSHQQSESFVRSLIPSFLIHPIEKIQSKSTSSKLSISQTIKPEIHNFQIPPRYLFLSVEEESFTHNRDFARVWRVGPIASRGHSYALWQREMMDEAEWEGEREKLESGEGAPLERGGERGEERYGTDRRLWRGSEWRHR